MPPRETKDEWNRWLAENAGRFLLFARQQTRSLHDAEDVLQEALVESWTRAQGRPESALVFSTIRRRAIDLGRSTDRRVHRENHQQSQPLFSTPFEDRETTAMVELELCRLPLEQREVITLKIWGGLTFSEISATLEIPQGTAASRYRLAVETLRKSITAPL